MNWQQATPIVSVILRHEPSGWMTTITLTGADGSAQWDAIKAAFPKFETTLLKLLETAAKLPAGVVV